jgi:hypothetical protein
MKMYKKINEEFLSSSRNGYDKAEVWECEGGAVAHTVTSQEAGGQLLPNAVSYRERWSWYSQVPTGTILNGDNLILSTESSNARTPEELAATGYPSTPAEVIRQGKQFYWLK